MAEDTTAPLLAPADDLATKVGTTATDARLLVALRAASARFRGAVRWQVHRVTDERLVVNGTGTRDLALPIRDIVDISAVEVDGVAVPVEWDEYGLLNRADGRLWPRRRRAVVITATYGFDPIPDDIAEAVQDQAEVGYNILRGLSSKQVGGITLTYGQSEAVGVSQAWSDAVDRYRIGGRT
ncbi:hypothetical protein NYO98_10470 [Nocardioides sp. STR2]|uniref:Mobile element protein n=1 Tax=Nocardioides pini TaxID=2975053 RepID=A0ABT4CFS1_9ACTN|nr:hypothetical protein [Nocardioides pini]MCY4726702.1 hypothetical protein [Nocardioides pini]